MTAKIEIIFTPKFTQAVKKLRRKYHHIVEDLSALLDQLRNGEIVGDQIPGVGYPVYKARLASSDMKRGKRGSFRVIYFLWLDDEASRRLMLVIYAKSRQENIAPDELRDLIRNFLKDE